jgi:hypothetical protein
MVVPPGRGERWQGHAGVADTVLRGSLPATGGAPFRAVVHTPCPSPPAGRLIVDARWRVDDAERP